MQQTYAAPRYSAAPSVVASHVKYLGWMVGVCLSGRRAVEFGKKRQCCYDQEHFLQSFDEG